MPFPTIFFRRVYTKFMKKSVLFLLTVLIVACAVVSGGAALGGKKFHITATLDGETLIDADYRIEPSAALRVVFLHRGSYLAYAEKEFNGNLNECLRYLNAQLYVDVMTAANDIYLPPTEPQAQFEDGVFTYTDGADGRRLNVEALCRAICVSLPKSVTTEAEIITTTPTKTLLDVKNATVKLAEFSTDFSTSGANRRHNIALAASKLNNVTVEPNASFSFNATVGERTVEAGFKEAKIINNGEFIQGVGGGVCQVSTTLFNCWLRAGLDFETAAAHSLPVSYVKPSLDAMVSSATDLVLKNSSDSTVYISAECAGSKIKFTLYGKPCGYDVVLRSATLRQVEAEYKTEYGDLDWGELETERIVKEGINGLVSESYRDFYSDGVLVRTERLRKNVYKPQQGLKILRKPEQKPAPETENKLDGSPKP